MKADGEVEPRTCNFEQIHPKLPREASVLTIHHELRGVPILYYVVEE